MSIIDTILQTRQREKENADKSIHQGLGTLGNVVGGIDERNRADAEKKRLLSSPVQNFLNKVHGGQMTGKDAAIAYKLVQGGHAAEDAFDYDPNTPGVQSREEAGLGTQSMPPPSAQLAPGTQGPAAPPEPMPQVSTEREGLAYSPAQPSRGSAPHAWTVQDVNDMGAALGTTHKPGTGLDLESRLALQADLYGRKGGLEDDKQDARSKENDKKLAHMGKALKVSVEEKQKDRDAAMERVIAQLQQSNVNNSRTNKSSEDMKLNDQMERAIANIRSSRSRIISTTALLADNPTALDEIKQLQDEQDGYMSELIGIREQIAKRVKAAPVVPSTSQTTTTKKPAPASADLLKKLRRQ